MAAPPRASKALTIPPKGSGGQSTAPGLTRARRIAPLRGGLRYSLSGTDILPVERDHAPVCANTGALVGLLHSTVSSVREEPSRVLNDNCRYARLIKQKQYSSRPPEPSPGARKCSLSTMWL